MLRWHHMIFGNATNQAHYFDNLYKLKNGDTIIYRTNMGERKYEVYLVKEIQAADWSVTDQTKDNIITLTTCITGHPELRLCVQGKQA